MASAWKFRGRTACQKCGSAAIRLVTLAVLNLQSAIMSDSYCLGGKKVSVYDATGVLVHFLSGNINNWNFFFVANLLRHF